MTRAENPPAYLERLRDEFAMAALQGLIGRNWSHIKGDTETILQWARSAYVTADALLAARQGGGQ